MHNMSNQDITIAKLEAALEQLVAVQGEISRWEHNLTAVTNNIAEVVEVSMWKPFLLKKSQGGFCTQVWMKKRKI